MNTFGISFGFDFINDSLNRSLSRVVALILLPVCVFLLSDIFWKVYYPDSVNLGRISDIGKELAEANRGTSASESWDWFKLRVAKPKAVKPAKINAKLIGILGWGNTGVAMIGLSNKTPQAFRVGQEIQAGVLLSRLGSDHVILLRDNTEEILYLEKPSGLFDGKTANNKPTGKVALEAENADITTLLREDPLQIARMVDFERVPTERYGDGYRVTPSDTSNYNLLADLELYPGDIILGVGRNQAVDVASNPRLWDSILRKDTIQIQVLRDGKLERTVVKLKK